MTPQISYAQDENNSPEDPLLFCFSPVSLQEIAIFKFAIEFWYDTIFRKYRAKFGGNELYEVYDDVRKICKCEYKGEILQSVENLHLPRRIRNLIRDALQPICERVSDWLSSEHDIFVFKNETCVSYSKFYRYLRCLAWEPNIEINYDTTARNLLSEMNSTNMKCHIMCKYCFEDEIKNISPLLFAEYEPPLKSYWKSYLMKDVQKLRRLHFRDLVMADDVCTWSAVMYFWNQLHDDERVPVSKRLLSSDLKQVVRRNQKRLLSKMTELQRCQLIAEIPNEIIVNFWLHSSEFELAFAIWNRVRNIITVEKFASLIDSVVFCQAYSFEEGGESMLMEIWRTAPDHLCNFVLHYEQNIIRIIKSYSLYCPRSRDTKFLLFMLWYIDRNNRIKIVTDHAFHLVIYNDPASIYEAIKFCFNFPNDPITPLLKFKKSIMESNSFNQHFKKLLKGGEFKQLNTLFELFSPDTFSSAEYKKRLLESCVTDYYRRFIFRPNEWKDLCSFIDAAFYNAPNLATDMKKQFILESSRICDYFYETEDTTSDGFWFDNRCLKLMLNVVENNLTFEEMAIFKQNVLYVFVKRIANPSYWCKFKPDVFRELELWCLGSDQQISEFKHSLLIDDIFNEIFTKTPLLYCGDHELRSENIVAVENLLKWYFVTPQEIQEYKLRRIYRFKEDASLRKFLRIRVYPHDSCDNNELAVRMMLPWFFDGDEDQIRSFKSDHCEDNLSAMISIPPNVYDYRLLEFESRIRSKMNKLKFDQKLGLLVDD